MVSPDVAPNRPKKPLIAQGPGTIRLQFGPQPTLALPVEYLRQLWFCGCARGYTPRRVTGRLAYPDRSISSYCHMASAHVALWRKLSR